MSVSLECESGRAYATRKTPVLARPIAATHLGAVAVVADLQLDCVSLVHEDRPKVEEGDLKG